MFRNVSSRQLTLGLVWVLLGVACLRHAAPPEDPAQVKDPWTPGAMLPSRPAAPTEPPGEAREAAHALLISAWICFGSPVYLDAIGVEPREATATVERACAPMHQVAAERGAEPEDEDAYLEAVRAAFVHDTKLLDEDERSELVGLFDKGLYAVREARSPWGLGPWVALAEYADTLTTPSLRDEARALATLLEADRRLRAEQRWPSSARELGELEARLVERSSHLSPSDLRTALDGVVQRLRTMI